MGIFSDETVIVVGVSTQQLVKGKYTELKDTALDALINGKELIPNVVETITNGFRSNVYKYHSIASAVVGYWNSLESYWPDVRFKQGLSGETIVVYYREVKSVFVDYTKLLPIFQSRVNNFSFYKRVYWTNKYNPLPYLKQVYMPSWAGWNPVTKELSQYPPEINTLGSVVKVTWAGNEASVELFDWGCTLEYVITLADNSTRTYMYTPLNVDEWMFSNKDLLVFIYSDSGEEKELIINVSELDFEIQKELHSNYVYESKYIPTVSIRKNFVNLIEDDNNPNLAPVKRALNEIGLDLQSITDSVMSTENGNDPNIIDDAFVGLGVNVRTTNKLCIRYLFDFFSYFVTSGKTESSEDTWNYFLNNYSDSTKSFFLEKQYTSINLTGGDEHSYQHQIRYLYSKLQYKAGNIGAIGDCTKEVVIRPTLAVGSFDVDVSSLILRKQITTGDYIEIEVVGLMFVGETYPSAIAKYELKDYEDDNKNHIYFPLIMGLLDSYGVFEQAELFKESLVLTVFAKDEVEIPWYLTEGFLELVQITLLVVSLLSGGSATPATTSIYELFKRMAIEAIKQIIIAKILKFAIKEISDLIGYDATIVLIAIAMLYGAYEISFGDLPWANDLLKISQLAQNAFNNQIEEDLADISEESKQREKEYKAALDEIEKVNETLNQNSMLNVMSRRYTFAFNPSETPDMFYNRTIHGGNVGVASLDTISTYVDRMLELPKIKNFGIIRDRT